MTSDTVFVRRHAVHGKHRRSSGCCCPCQRLTQKIGPEEASIPGYDTITLSKNKTLRIRHVNPQPREPAFETQMQEFIRREYSEIKSSLFQPNPVVGDCGFVSSVNHSPDHVVGSTRSRTKSAGPMRSSLNLRTQHIPSPHDNPGKILNDTVNTGSNGRTRTATSVIVNVDNKYDSPKHQPRLSFTNEDDIEDIPVSPRTQVTSSTTKSRDPLVQNTAVFMFHGVGGSSDVWHAQINYLEHRGYEIIIPDFIGHGFSSTPKDPNAYSFNQLAHDMLFIFDKYCKKSNIVIGHSYGSSFACYLAKERASFVRHLVTISGGSPTPLAPQPGIFHWPVCCLKCCNPLLKSHFKKSAFHVKKPRIPHDKAFDVPAYVLKHTMNGQNWPDGTFEYHSLITAKTLVIHGEHDGLIGLHEEEEMVQAIPDAELIVVEDASHMVMMEQPDRLNSILLDLIMRDSQTPR